MIAAGKMSYKLIFGYTVLAALGLAFLVLTILVIRVMTLDTPSPPDREARRSTHVVRDGDTLAAISDQTGVPVERIESLNPSLDPLALVPGRRIRLKPVTARERRRAARRRARLPKRYVVRAGDGLLLIEERTKVDIARLRALNPDKDLKKLIPGMRLRLRR